MSGWRKRQASTPKISAPANTMATSRKIRPCGTNKNPEGDKWREKFSIGRENGCAESGARGNEVSCRLNRWRSDGGRRNSCGRVSGSDFVGARSVICGAGAKTEDALSDCAGNRRIDVEFCAGHSE